MKGLLKVSLECSRASYAISCTVYFWCIASSSRIVLQIRKKKEDFSLKSIGGKASPLIGSRVQPNVRQCPNVCPPKFCISIVSGFSWDSSTMVQKQKQCLCKILGRQAQSFMVFFEVAFSTNPEVPSTRISFHLKTQLFVYGYGFPLHVSDENDH